MKGTAVQSSLRYVKESLGPESLGRILERLEPPDRHVLDQGVLPSSWYPMDVFLRFMQEAERQLRAQDKELLRHMGRAHSSCVHRGGAVCRFEGRWD